MDSQEKAIAILTFLPHLLELNGEKTTEQQEQNEEEIKEQNSSSNNEYIPSYNNINSENNNENLSGNNSDENVSGEEVENDMERQNVETVESRNTNNNNNSNGNNNNNNRTILPNENFSLNKEISFFKEIMKNIISLKAKNKTDSFNLVFQKKLKEEIENINSYINLPDHLYKSNILKSKITIFNFLLDEVLRLLPTNLNSVNNILTMTKKLRKKIEYNTNLMFEIINTLSDS